MDTAALVITIIGALNWGLISLFQLGNIRPTTFLMR